MPVQPEVREQLGRVEPVAEDAPELGLPLGWQISGSETSPWTSGEVVPVTLGVACS